jgi:hypothetical protein
MFQIELAADVVTVEQNSIFRKIEQLGYLLVGLAFLDQIGYFDFGGGQVEVFG